MKRFLVILSILVAVGIRFYYFWYPLGRSSEITVDEAVYGVQALQIMKGEHPVFYPAQDYTGSFSAYLSSFVFRIFGVSSWGLKAIPFVFSLLTIFLIYKLSLEALGKRVALLSLLVSSLGTPFWNNWSSRAGTGYVEATFLGLVLMILSLRMVKMNGQIPKILFLVYGLTSGLGFWIQPTIVYFFMPSFVYLVFNLKKRLLFWPLVFIIFGFFLGAIPVVYHNLFVRPGGTSTALFKKPWGVRGAAVKLITQGFPVLLGGRTANSLTDFNSYTSFFLYILFVLSLIYFVVKTLKGFSISRPETLITLTFFSTVLIFLTSTPFNQLAIEPRYVYSLYGPIPIILGLFISKVWRITRTGSVLILSVYLVAFVLGLVRAGPLSFLDDYSFVNLVSFMREKGINYTMTTPSLGHRLMFFSKGEVRARVIGGGITEARFEEINLEVGKVGDSDPRLVAFVALFGESQNENFAETAQQRFGPRFNQSLVDNRFKLYFYQ